MHSSGRASSAAVLVLSLFVGAGIAWGQGEDKKDSDASTPAAVAGPDAKSDTAAPATPGDTAATDKTATDKTTTPDKTPPPPQPSPEKTAEAVSIAVDGYLRQSFRVRHAGSETNADSYSDLFLNVKRGGAHPLSLRLNGRMVANLSGSQQRNDLLREIWDGFDSDVQVRLYEAYVQVEKLFDQPLQVRAGRQFIDEGTYLQFDGARADVGPIEHLKNLHLTAYGGIPVRFGDPDRDGNWLAGCVLAWKADKLTRVRVDYVHVTEYFHGINTTVVDPSFQPVVYPAQHIDDDLVGVSAWRKVGDNLRLFGRFSLLDGNANELHLRGRWWTKDGLWLVVADYYEMFGRLELVTNELTPFVPMLGSLEPFWRLSVRATRRIGDDWIVQGGYSHRALIHSSREGPFNHEFNHYYASVTRAGLLDGKLDAVFMGTGFTSNRNDVGAVDGSLDFRPNKKTTISGGIDYSLYKYDFLRNAEMEDVWSYWIRSRYKLTKKTLLRGEFRVDDDRYTTFFTFLVSIEVRF